MTTKDDGRWVNVTLAVSNVLGVPLIFAARDASERVLMCVVLLASLLMHASERKHGLPGIAPLNRYSNMFLWIDRWTALSCAVWGLLHASRVWHASGFTSDLALTCAMLMVGLVALGVSEHACHTHKRFVMAHGAWHALAYTALFRVMRA